MFFKLITLAKVQSPQDLYISICYLKLIDQNFPSFAENIRLINITTGMLNAEFLTHYV